MRSNNSSISASVMTSGGQTAMRSPSSGAHDQAFLLAEVADRSRPPPWRDRKLFLVFLSATSSMPPIRPTPSASPTSGWSDKRRQPPAKSGRRLGAHGRRCRVLDRSRSSSAPPRGHRMAGIGEAVAERADLAGFGYRPCREISGDISTAEIGR